MEELEASEKPVKRMLDLFSGTRSVGAEFQRHGYEVVSVDLDPRCEPTHQVDVLRWKYSKAYPPGWFDVIFASPPCEHFSRAKTIGFRDLGLADRLVRKALDMIRYFKPEKWFLENPQTGMLKERPYVQGIPYIDVEYCQFSEWG